MAGDHRRRAFVGLTINNLTHQPWSQVVGAYLTLLVASRTTSAVAISFALSAHRGFAAVLMPVIGRLSDRTATRGGRRVPLMVVGTAVGAVIVMLMTRTSGYWPLLVAIVVTRISLQVASIGSVGVTPDVFGRSRWAKAVGAIAAIGFLPGLLTLGLIRQTWDQDDPSSWDITFLVAGAGLLIGAVAVALLVREAPASEEVAAIAAKGHWRDELDRIRAIPNGVHVLATVGLLALAFAGINRLLPVWARDELDVGGAEFASVSLVVLAVTVALVPVGLWLGSRAHPRLLAISAALVGAAVTATMTVITEPAMFVVLTAISLPLTVAAFASLAPQFIPLFPKGDRLGQSFGIIVGPFGLVMALAGLASATVVDVVGTTDALWVIASGLLLALAANLATLHLPGDARTDVRGLLRNARDAGMGPGLFDGSVDLEDVLGVGAIALPVDQEDSDDPARRVERPA
jgi:Na+/melibiose symporter-like transporter